MKEEYRYIVVDFKGYIRWIKSDDKTYLIDPLYLKLFLDTFK
jgi:hypothetical protein